jgi:hypothetical protein
MLFLYSLLESLKDLTRKEILQLSVYNGLFWAAVWIVAAFFSWGYMLDITHFLINLLPFKFVQDSGAEFIFVIMWLQVVLVSIGILFSLFYSFFKKRLVSILAVLFLSLFWFAVFLSFKAEIIGYLQKLIKIFPFESIEEAVSAVFSVFVYYSFYIVSVYLGFLLFSEKHLLKLVEEEYPYIEVNTRFSKFKIIKVLLKDFMIFILMLILFYPLLFVPFVNLLLIVGLWSYVVKNALFETVFSLFDKIELNPKTEWGFAVVSVFLNFIPLVNLFSPALGVLSLYHYIMEKKTEMLENG